MKYTKKFIELILSSDFKEELEGIGLNDLLNSLVKFAKLASKEIVEQEASERGEQK